MTQYIFLAGWEVRLNGDAQCEAFIRTQAVAKEVAEVLPSATELIFEKGALIAAYTLEEGDRSERILRKDEKGLPWANVSPNKSLVFEGGGPHLLGGAWPESLKAPQVDCATSFQYVGCIKRTEPAFGWLPHDLHLVCPIYLTFDRLLMDYSDPLGPVVFNAKEIAEAESSFDEVGPDSLIEFHGRSFNFIESMERFGQGFAGFPTWIQYPSIPRCPKTGNVMRFVCQLSGGAVVARSNIVPSDDYNATCFEDLNFWEDGDLFVFFEPNSRMACYIIQNT